MCAEDASAVAPRPIAYRTMLRIQGEVVHSATFDNQAQLDVWLAELTHDRARLGARFSRDKPRTPFPVYAALWLDARPKGLTLSLSLAPTAATWRVWLDW